MSKPYDAIIVGARCAGSPTAMLLARRGHRVLLVDRATFPSDTLSTHLIHPAGMASLSRWGLRDALVATGCPAIDTYAFDFGPIAIAGSPGTEASPVAYCPRRTVLDKLLVDAAAAAGAEIREGFTVDEILIEDGQVAGIRGRGAGGESVTERARIVIGADGRTSRVADAVHAESYNERPPILSSYYSYWSGVPMAGTFEVYIRDHRGIAAIPTHDELTLIIAGWPHAEFEANRGDIEGNFLRTLDLEPAFAARVRAGKRIDRFFGASVANFFRKPFGPGWALVGDAGYNKDPITAQGITDAFRDAELCSTAVDEWIREVRPFADAMAAYQQTRDAQVLPMYDLTCQIATLEPPPPEMQQLLGAVRASQPAMNRFVQMQAGTISPAEFFAPDSVGAMFAAASAVQA